jgi:hypothetical protein
VPNDAAWGLAGELDVIEHLGDYGIAYVKLPGQPGNIAVKLDGTQAIPCASTSRCGSAATPST